MKKTEKTFFVQDLTERLKTAKSIVLVDYSGLNVSMQRQLRERLRGVGAEMLVVKNTLFKLAAKNAKLNEDIYQDKVISGPTALILTEEDPISPLQVLHKFALEFEIPNFKAGIIEKKFQEKEILLKLAQLPSKEVLIMQVLSNLSSPIYALTTTLSSNLQNLLYLVQNIKDLKGGGE